MPDYQHRFEELNDLQAPADGDSDVLLVTSFVGMRVNAHLTAGREFTPGQHIVEADVTLTGVDGETASTQEALFPTALGGAAFARILYSMAFPGITENATNVTRRYRGMPAERLGEHVQDAFEESAIGFPLTFRVELFGNDYTVTLTQPDGSPPSHVGFTITSDDTGNDLVSEWTYSFNNPPVAVETTPRDVERDVFEGLCRAMFNQPNAARPFFEHGFADTITDSDGDVVLEPPSEGVSDSVVVVDQ